MGRTYHYTYRVKFPDTGHFYFGLHSTNDLNDSYEGSPHTHRWMWEFYDHEVEVLEFFADRATAADLETRLIKPFLRHPMCLNENAGGGFSTEAQSRGGKIGGLTKGTENHAWRNSEHQRKKSQKRWDKDDGTGREKVRQLGLENVRNGTLAKALAASNKVTSKPIEVTCPDGQVLQFPSGAEAGRQLGVDGNALTGVARGVRPHHKHYTATFLK